MNPCNKCGNNDVQVNGLEVYCSTNECSDIRYEYDCSLQSAIDAWNNANPLSEVDEVAMLESKLTECYELLEASATLSLADIRTFAKELLAKHRGN